MMDIFDMRELLQETISVCERCASAFSKMRLVDKNYLLYCATDTIAVIEKDLNELLPRLRKAVEEKP
jgi:hypothetical protein